LGNATLEARNLLTEYLFLHHRAEYNAWNTLAISAREFIQENVVPRNENVFADSLPKDCLGSVQWDIHSAIMEDTYAFLNHPFVFFSQLLQIYEAGHLPCGWVDGKYPKGVLLIY
jgi:hypothetical protein